MVFNSYQVKGELAVELPEHATSLELIKGVLQNTNILSKGLMEKGFVKMNIQMALFSQARVAASLWL